VERRLAVLPPVHLEDEVEEAVDAAEAEEEAVDVKATRNGFL